MRSYLGQLAVVRPELKQPAAKMNTGRFTQQGSSADDRGLGQGLKEERRMDVGYFETADVKGVKQRVKTKGVRHERVRATWRSS